MDALDILRDLASRPRHAAEALRGRIDAHVLAAHPGEHPNSVAWLLWHTGREIDVQLAALTGAEEVWRARRVGERLGLGEEGAAVGYGHSPDEARAIAVADGEALVDYVAATLDAVDSHLDTLTAWDLAAVVDEEWDPPVTQGARLVSILDDAIQHLAQAAYVLGMPRRG
ncbi:mycothiol transferase [Brachybacterium saurashtrense]|uniref:DUF664 domain-containing protein n=1 Tax=Brachybacterium saurashtrense TaxID=556288 RepID=A0A345YSJ9_9MICO|nr:DinB family protein [Brachybacterium saurashtrense]AXK46901.1 DUF664 domain-containing protein [Brachybacterium saurashtrense]RRR22616.1 DUF664 domain-containing protein [Brachybacterium saurashtrense]